MVWWTCSREEMTLPSWTSSTMVRTWRVVTAAGDRHLEVGGGRETPAQPPAPERSQLSPLQTLGVQASVGPSTSHPLLWPSCPRLLPPSILSLCRGACMGPTSQMQRVMLTPMSSAGEASCTLGAPQSGV